jgi:hypothetical protein
MIASVSAASDYDFCTITSAEWQLSALRSYSQAMGWSDHGAHLVSLSLSQRLTFYSVCFLP